MRHYKKPKRDLDKIVKRKQSRESKLEAKMKAYCHTATMGQCIVLKTGFNGWPDNACFFGNGGVFLFEVKRPDGDGVVSKRQAYNILKLQDMGHNAEVFDDFEKFKIWVRDCINMRANQ